MFEFIFSILTIGWIHRQGEVHPEDFRDDVCVASVNSHKKPLPLEFCEWHVKDSCCTPMHDAAAQEFFVGLTQLGLPCTHATHAIKHRYLRLRYWGCLACDPDEPLYRYKVHLGYPKNNIPPEVVPTALTLEVSTNSEQFTLTLQEGDYVSGNNSLYYLEEMNIFVADLNGSLHYSAPAKLFQHAADLADWSGSNVTVRRTTHIPVQFSWRVCKSFLDGMWNGAGDVDDRNGHLFDDCGMILNGEGVIPSALFQGPTAATDFISQLSPPNFDTVGGFQFVVVDDVNSNTTTCSLCTPDVATQSCLNCPNGCTFSNLPTGPACLEFNHDLTPCFLGEDTGLPGSFATSQIPKLWFIILLVIVFISLI